LSYSAAQPAVHSKFAGAAGTPARDALQFAQSEATQFNIRLLRPVLKVRFAPSFLQARPAILDIKFFIPMKVGSFMSRVKTAAATSQDRLL